MIIDRLKNILLPSEKRKYARLLVIILLVSILEVAGVASILPFMELIANPEAIQQNEWLRNIYKRGWFANERQMLLWSGILVIATLAVANVMGIIAVWFQHRYTWQISHQLSTRLLATYLRKPYAFYLNQNSADLKTYILGEIVTLTTGVLLPLLELISRLMVVLVIFSLLVLVNPVIALSSLAALGGSYGFIYLLRQRHLKRLGEDRLAHNVKRYRSLGELLSGIKTVTTYNSQDYFYQRFAEASERFTDIAPRFTLTMKAPRFLLEIVAFGGILGITLYMYLSTGNIQDKLPLLSLYAVAGYRMLPALQNAFGALAKFRHNYPVVERLHKDLTVDKHPIDKDDRPIVFENEIRLQQLGFSYEGSETALFTDFNLSIPQGSTVAFVGTTGSGKTTLIDLLSGLLQPTTGEILLDGTPLTPANAHAWRRLLAYVPQQVFLFDDSVLRNIVMGTNEPIDHERLDAACRMASIFDFIQQELPNGYQTEIGENGVRLSGGQRQRLGLARALYRQPRVLILDEATSALDNITEQSVVASLEDLPPGLTRIIIAHRLSSVRSADIIYFLEHGRVTAAGTYDELVAQSEAFRTMAELS